MNIKLQMEAIDFRNYCEKISSGVLLTDRKIAEIIEAAIEYVNNTKELIKVFDKVGFRHGYKVDEHGKVVETLYTVIEGKKRNGIETIDFLRTICLNHSALSA